jgi:hypothetical protein
MQSDQGFFGRLSSTLASSQKNEQVMLDSTIVRAHRHCAGAKKSGRSGTTTEKHVIADALNCEKPCIAGR